MASTAKGGGPAASGGPAATDGPTQAPPTDELTDDALEAVVGGVSGDAALALAARLDLVLRTPTSRL